MLGNCTLFLMGLYGFRFVVLMLWVCVLALYVLVWVKCGGFAVKDWFICVDCRAGFQFVLRFGLLCFGFVLSFAF